MDQSNEAWNDVVEQVKGLGSSVKHHYQAQDREGGEDAAPEEEVRDVLLALGEIVKAAFATVGDVIADPGIQSEARQVAGSFLDALGTTFSELGDDITHGGEKLDAPDLLPPGLATEPDAAETED